MNAAIEGSTPMRRSTPIRIVILSLLRIGDTLMHLQVIRELRRKYPEASVDLVINDECSQGIEILKSEVSNVIQFPRKRFQILMNSRDTHLLEPIWQLQEWTQQVASSPIELLINLTHNRVSGYLMGLLTAEHKMGLVIESGKSHLYGNEWLRYLNEHFSSGLQSQFHLIEALARSLDIEVSRIQAKRGEAKKILIQPLTSDAKKNWALIHWKNLLAELRSHLPDYSISVLAAPSEVEILSRYFQSEDLFVSTLLEAKNALEQSELLVSGDTSLIHLASLVQTRSLMLSLGSSDPMKTGPFLDGSVIVSGRSPCRPCRHTQICDQSSHLCGESITVRQLTDLVISLVVQSHIQQTELRGGNDNYGKEARKLPGDSSAEARISI